MTCDFISGRHLYRLKVPDYAYLVPTIFYLYIIICTDYFIFVILSSFTDLLHIINRTFLCLKSLIAVLVEFDDFQFKSSFTATRSS